MKLLKRVFLLLFYYCQYLGAQTDKYEFYQRLLPINDDSTKCVALINYAKKVTDSLYDYSFALLIYEKTNGLLQNKKHPSLEVELYFNWAYALYKSGNYNKSDELLTKALTNKVVLDKTPKLKIKILTLAGENLEKLNRYKKALAYYSAAIDLYTRLNEEGIEDIYVDMAKIFILTGDLNKAEELLNKAAKTLLQNNKIERYTAILSHKAYIKSLLGKPEESKNLLLQSLRLTKVKTGIITDYFNLGFLYMELKKSDSCFYYLNKGKKIADSLNLTNRFEGTYYRFVAYSYSKKGDFKNSIHYYKKAINSKNGVANYKELYNNLSELYLTTKQYDSAFMYKDKLLLINDSIYKSELKEQLHFENKRVELLEKDYQDQLKAVHQQQSLNDLRKRNYLFISIIITLIVLALLFFLYFRQYQLKRKKEHLQSELDFLKAQLNPHFLFNSINNIYVLLDENKEKAGNVLLKFSDLLRYQLYDCNVSKILLSKELQFLENFIEFENLRYSDKIEVNYNFKDIPSHNFLIAPLLLQPFIENAFKHTPKNKTNKSKIDIQVSLTHNNLFFEIINTATKESESELPGGIGLENVKRRLKLLYHNRFEMNTVVTETLYKINLKLTLEND